MIKPVLYIIILFQLFLTQATAQENLVPNGSFEEQIYCPQNLADLPFTNWFSAVTTTPDCFYSCTSFQCGVPNNIYGHQFAKHGNGYGGIVLNSDDGYREYLAVKLVAPLTALKKYRLSFYVSLCETSKYSSNNMGAYFVKDTSTIPLIMNMGGTPMIISATNIVFDESIITDTINWTELTFEYTASGCEEYLILGNFRSQEQTTFGQNTGIGLDTYYYIDDVTLIEINSVDLPNIFTPNGDGINDRFEIDDTQAKQTQIINRWGNLVYESNNLIQWDGGDQPDGIYYYTIDLGCGTNSNIKTGFVQLLR